VTLNGPGAAIPVSERTARSADGIEIAYDVRGPIDGRPAIVFVHGWSCDRTYWRGQADAFAGRHRVVTVDLAGHGASGAGRRSWTMPAFGADLAAVVEAEDLREAVLVGHSMGGDVIAEGALLVRDRVLGLVWVDTYRTLEDEDEDDDEAGLNAFVESFRNDFRGAVDAFVRRVTPASSGVELVDWIANDMASAPREIALDALDHAVHGLRPTRAAIDRLGLAAAAINPPEPPSDEASLARHGVELLTMTGVGHFAMLEDPPKFNRLLAGVVAGFASS